MTRPPTLPAPASRALRSIRRALMTLDSVLDDPYLSFEQAARLYGELDRTLAHDPPGITQCAAAVRDRAAHLANSLYPWPKDADSVTVEHVGTLAPSLRGASTKWEDGRGLAARVAARVADEAFDQGTGEAKPMAVVVHEVAMELVQCAGLDNASQQWRGGELEQRGIDPSKYKTKTGGEKSVRFTD